MYYSWTTLTSVGYGDIVPFTPLERIYAIITMSFAVAFFSYITAVITSIVNIIFIKEAEYRYLSSACFCPWWIISAQLKHMLSVAFRRKMTSLVQFLKISGLPPELQKKLRRYFHHNWTSQSFQISAQQILRSVIC